MGFVPNMRVPCTFFVNQHLQQLLFEELEQYVARGDVGGFLPAVKQLANVAALPGKFCSAWLLRCRFADRRSSCRHREGVPGDARRSQRLRVCHWQRCGF